MRRQRTTRAVTMMRNLPRRSAVSRLHIAYFSQAAESASRYGLTFERVLQHLWDARRTNRRLLLRSVSYIDDLVHAIACVDGIGLAWADLAARYERALVRNRRSGHDEVMTTLQVRQMFAELRRRNARGGGKLTPSLRNYVGNRPLRNWLTDRLVAAEARHKAAACASITRPRPEAIWPAWHCRSEHTLHTSIEMSSSGGLHEPAAGG